MLLSIVPTRVLLKSSCSNDWMSHGHTEPSSSSSTMSSTAATHPFVLLSHEDFSDILEASRIRVTSADSQVSIPPRRYHPHHSSSTSLYRISKSYKPVQHHPSISRISQSRIQQTLKHAWAASTMEKYAGGVQHFNAFCDRENVDTCFRLPASEFLLCAFASSRSGEIAGTTVRNEISAIRAWHILNDVHYHGSLRLSYVLKGVENLRPESSKRPPRPPITVQMLLFLHHDLDLNNPFDACVEFAATSAFWGQIRLGEILSPTQDNWDLELIPSQHHMRPPHTSAGSRLLHLPNTKVAGRKGENISLCRQYGPSDPTSTFTNHMRINDIPADYPLYSYKISASKYRALTKRKFLSRCNEVWSKHGLPISTGHSFRIGGTTELLLAGVAPHIVKLMGRWSSDAFLTYWRNLEIVAPLHAELLEHRIKGILKKTKPKRSTTTP